MNFSLLRSLADGDVRSGRTLAAALGCSPWVLRSRLREIAKLGVGLRGLPGRGYRLDAPVDLIDRAELGALLSRMPWPFRVHLPVQCESTNSLLLARSREGAPHASVVACEHQTAGRGRQGNAWLSGVGDSLVFSLLWRFRRHVGELTGIGLAVAVGAARALESLGTRGVGLKWPNDLVIGDAKLGGILIETVSGKRRGNDAADAPAAAAAVIGVGINVRGAKALSARLGRPVADLTAEGTPPTRTRLLACLLAEIAAAMGEFDRAGFSPFRPEWHARHAWQGRRVVLSISQHEIAVGTALGVAEDGALLLRSRSGLERHHAGEISLRRA